MAGWISLHRQIQNHWIWEDPQKLKWWLDILLRTNHKDNKTIIGNKLVVIKRGTFHTSEVKLSEQWNVSRNTVRSFLKLLENDEMISTNRTANGTTVKVLNYNDYQTFSPEKNQLVEQHSEQLVKQNTEQLKDSSLNSSLNTNNNDNNELIMKNNENNDNNQSVGVVFQHYEDLGFGLLNGHKAEQINQWIQTFNTEVVIEAMKIASNANKSTMGYLNGILNNWKEKGFKSIEEVKAESIQRRGSNKTRSYGTPNPYHHNDDLPF